MPNLTKQDIKYVVFVGDRLEKGFDDKKDAVHHAKELSKTEEHAPWNYNVYKMQQIWTADK